MPHIMAADNLQILPPPSRQDNMTRLVFSGIFTSAAFHLDVFSLSDVPVWLLSFVPIWVTLLLHGQRVGIVSTARCRLSRFVAPRGGLLIGDVWRIQERR